MSLRRWLSEGRLRRQPASAKELADLMRVIHRDLSDAEVVGLSIDRRYATAYNAALQLATLVLRASGYRTAGVGHHWISFQILLDLWGPAEQERVDYFDSCRQKRNVADYGCAGQVGDAELSELLEEVRRFQVAVQDWLRKEHPDLPQDQPGG
jgi:hypothetical protein